MPDHTLNCPNLIRAAWLVSVLAAACGGEKGPTQPVVLRFAALSAGGTHTCAITTGGAAYCWGDNEYGVLGSGATTGDYSRVPVPVYGGLSFAALTAGLKGVFSHTCGLTTGMVAYCWGSNIHGQLGTGTTTNSYVPLLVSGGLRFAALAAGIDNYLAGGTNSCGLTTGGAAYCWGSNGAGQLGTGTTTNSNVPVVVSGGLSFTALSSGGGHNCALTTDGTAYCWGLNSYGQLGIGTTTNSSVPVPVSGGLTFIALSAGFQTSCGIAAGGAAYCWGRNFYGQLGTGTTTDTNVPVLVAGGLSFAAITVSAHHSCGLTTGGAAYCWGYNEAGQLGTGTTTNSSVPVPVSGGLSLTALSAGGDHSCGLTTGEAIYCWGLGLFGELGTGTTTNSSVPVRVSGG